MWFTDNTANVSQSDDTPARWVVTKEMLMKNLRDAKNIKNKRISGTRGQSRYHYYGLAVKETSPYYDPGKICNDLKKEPDGNISIQPTLERRPQSKPGGPFYIMLLHTSNVTHFLPFIVLASFEETRDPSALQEGKLTYRRTNSPHRFLDVLIWPMVAT